MSTKTKSPTKKYDFERAIEVKSKEELSFLMIEKSLEYLHHSTKYNHGHIIEYLPPTVYYTDSQGQVYKFIEQPKPIVNPFGKNRQTLESNIDSFSIIFKNLLASANENNENAFKVSGSYINSRSADDINVFVSIVARSERDIGRSG